MISKYLHLRLVFTAHTTPSVTLQHLFASRVSGHFMTLHQLLSDPPQTQAKEKSPFQQLDCVWTSHIPHLHTHACTRLIATDRKCRSKQNVPRLQLIQNMIDSLWLIPDFGLILYFTCIRFPMFTFGRDVVVSKTPRWGEFVIQYAES